MSHPSSGSSAPDKPMLALEDSCLMPPGENRGSESITVI